MRPSRSRSPHGRFSSNHQDKCPFSMFARKNHANFLANTYSMLGELEDNDELDTEDSET